MTLSEWFRIYLYRSWLQKLLSHLPAKLESALPYPKEKPDWSRTLENTTVEAVKVKWLSDYRVPGQFHDFWNGVKVLLEQTAKPAPWTMFSPADTIAQEKWRRTRLNVAYANSGIIAHEFAHISYYFLTQKEAVDFSSVFHTLRKEDDLLQVAWEAEKYMRKNDYEGHAECYRIFGDKMPGELKQFYPKLI